MNQNAKIGEVKDILQVTPQTIRNWLNLGDVFFSESATRKTGKRFTPSDIQQLQRIKTLLGEGLTYEQIKDQLTAAPEIIDFVEDTPPEQHQDPINAIQQTEMYEQFMRLFNQQSDNHQRELERLETSKNETIQVLKDEIEYLKRPWYKRLTR